MGWVGWYAKSFSCQSKQQMRLMFCCGKVGAVLTIFAQNSVSYLKNNDDDVAAKKSLSVMRAKSQQVVQATNIANFSRLIYLPCQTDYLEQTFTFFQG